MAAPRAKGRRTIPNEESPGVVGFLVGFALGGRLGVGAVVPEAIQPHAGRHVSKKVAPLVEFAGDGDGGVESRVRSAIQSRAAGDAQRSCGWWDAGRDGEGEGGMDE